MVLRDLKRQLGFPVHREKMLEDPRSHTLPATFSSAGCSGAYVPKGLDVVGTFLRRPGDSGVLSGGCGKEGTDSGGSPDRTSLWLGCNNQEAAKDDSRSIWAMDVGLSLSKGKA